MSGSSRSTPRCSSRGNASPASTTMISSPSSYTVMFLPTSPRPPSGMIRSVSLIGAESTGVRRGEALRARAGTRPRPTCRRRRARHGCATASCSAARASRAGSACSFAAPRRRSASRTPSTTVSSTSSRAEPGSSTIRDATRRRPSTTSPSPRPPPHDTGRPTISSIVSASGAQRAVGHVLVHDRASRRRAPRTSHVGRLSGDGVHERQTTASHVRRGATALSTPGIAAPAPSAASMSSNAPSTRPTGCEQAEALEAVADRLALLVRRLDERQPVPADLVAEQIQRALDRDRVHRDAQESIDGRELPSRARAPSTSPAR